MPAMTVAELFARYTPEVRSLAEKTRALVLELFPTGIEQVDAPDAMVAYGTGPRMAQQVFYIAGFKSHVNLGFMHGAELDDPAELLEGTGKRLRHVKIRKVEDVGRPELRELMQEEIRLCESRS
jgi:hypothetical protein